MDYGKLRELSPAERRFKSFWQQHPERGLDRPCQEEQVRDVLNYAFRQNDSVLKDSFSPNVAEQTFIPPELDCAFVQHQRYTPVFWHRHEFFELLCVLSGGCDNVFEQEELRLEAGDICIHAPGTVHAVRAFSDDALLLNILIRKSTFDRSFFGLMEEESILSNFFRTAFSKTAELPFLLFRTGGDAQIRSLILYAMEEYRHPQKYRRSLLNAMLSELMIRVFQTCEQRIVIPERMNLSANHEDLMNILRYVQENYRSVTMHELSLRFNYSERQLQRIFLQSTGMSFRDAIQNQKMQKAAELLRTTDKTVRLVAEESGFQSLNNFRKLFARHYQLSPSKYREKYRVVETPQAPERRTHG